VDFAGDTMPVLDAITGEARAAKIFVAVLGASNYTYAEARFSEALPEWICAHVNTFAFLGGVPKAVVCDNLKAGVTAASPYEPAVNRTYEDLAAHYAPSSFAIPAKGSRSTSRTLRIDNLSAGIGNPALLQGS
jgi:transposase